MKIVAIKDMSAGNDTVGDMWQETKIFEDTALLSEVIKWAGAVGAYTLKKRVTLTIPDGQELLDESK